MSIIRKPRTSAPFTTILNAVVEDEALSPEALGVLVYLVGKPDGWKVMPMQLKNRFGCGRDRIYRIINDLIAAGYMKRDQDRSEAGGFGEGNYLVSDEKFPLTENKEAAVSDLPHPENPTLQKKQSKKETSDSHSIKRGDQPYSDDFEAIWQQYPRTKNTSKKDAWNFYRMLTDDKQEMVRRAVPVFAAAMRAEGRTEDKIMHMIRFLRGGVFETVAAPTTTSSGATAKPGWHKTATREQWQKILTIWSSTNDWRASWGPAPGKPGCGVPEDMVAAHNVAHRGHMFSPEQLDAFREIASKHAVDKASAA